LDKEEDVARVLAAWAVYMHRLTDRRDHEELEKLNGALTRAGLRLTDSGITRAAGGQRPAFGETPTPLWPRDHFRLFLSHVSSFKIPTADLRKELLDFNVAGFVAHEDIEPSAEWQREIERALGEMDALVALLTTGFTESRWTSQEVGWAFGRGDARNLGPV
jgi:hypothetical protein